jgi:RNA polymerase sigma factor (sigma-70 family)
MPVAERRVAPTNCHEQREVARVEITQMPKQSIRIEPESRIHAYIRKSARRRRFSPDETVAVVELVEFYLSLLEQSEPGLIERIEFTLGSPTKERPPSREMELLRVATHAAIGDGGRSRPQGKRALGAIEEYQNRREQDDDHRPQEWGNRAYLVLLIRVAIDCLDVEDRELIKQCYYKDFTVRKIAVETGVPKSTVEDRKKKAINRLKDMIDQLMAEFQDFIY